VENHDSNVLCVYWCVINRQRWDLSRPNRSQLSSHLHFIIDCLCSYFHFCLISVFNEAEIPCLTVDFNSSNIVSDNERWDRDTCVIWKRYNNSLLRVDGVRSIGLTLPFNEIKPTDHGKYFCVLCSDKQCSEGIRIEFIDLQVVSAALFIFSIHKI
jgi:hypothetical protein